MELTQEQKDERWEKVQGVLAKLPDDHRHKNNPRGFGLSKEDYTLKLAAAAANNPEQGQ